MLRKKKQPYLNNIHFVNSGWWQQLILKNLVRCLGEKKENLNNKSMSTCKYI